jgi:hypothetical protein
VKNLLIVSYVAFLLNPLFSLVFILMGILKDRNHNTHYSFLLAGVFTSFAYWVIPRGEMDLTRYFEQVAFFGNMSWTSFVNTVLTGDYLFIQNILFYFIGKTGNYHLLPAIVIFISYFIMFYMLTDYANRMEARSSEILFALLFLICVMPFISLVSNVRNILAFSIISFAIYREFIQNKKNILTVLCYIIPLFIHISSLSLIVIKIIAQKSSKVKAKNISIVVTFIILIILIFNNAEALRTLPFLGEYIGSFISKANNYITDSTSLEYVRTLQQSTFSKLQKLYFVSTVLFLLLIVNIKTINNSNFKFENYYKYVSYVVIACYPIILTVYFRFTMAVLMFAFICIIFRIRDIQHKDWKMFVYVGLVIIMIFGVIQQTIFFNRLAYIDEMFYNMALRSIFNMFIQ